MALLKKSIAIAAVFGFLLGCGGTNQAVERMSVEKSTDPCREQRVLVDPGSGEKVTISVCSHIGVLSDGDSILMHNRSCEVGKIIGGGKITQCL